MAGLDWRLRAAVDANIAWYEDLMQLHGVASAIENGLWRSLGPPPPLHSDAVTIEPQIQVDEVERALADRDRWAFKDSFSAIRPSGADVELLFAATWIHRAPSDGPPRPAGRWTRVTDAAGLAEWTGDDASADVLLPALLERGHFKILARRADGEIVAGAIARLGSGVVDVSNVHAAPGNEVDWEELTADVSSMFPGRPMVGYERDEDLAAALAGGFEPVGELRIWTR